MLIRLLYLLCIITPGFCLAEDLSSSTLYLTWQGDPTTTMTIQWLSESSAEDSRVMVQRVGEERWKEVKGTHFALPHPTHYTVYRVELTGLSPNQDYRFKRAADPQEFLFRTMPDNDRAPVRFVVGGDMYQDTTKWMEATCRQATKTDPYFAVVGGDIAYAVWKKTKTVRIERWITWLQTWHRAMVTEEGRLIPVIAVIGNHDLAGEFDQTPQQARLFGALFPMPGYRIYNVFDAGNYLSLWLLDSGHANPVGGQQTEWLEYSLLMREEVPHKFAVYHVPAYPSIRPFPNSRSAAIRTFWIPLFEKGGIQAAFEHHDHCYKRTYPLIKGDPDPRGVLYLGDGSWGVDKPRVRKSRRNPLYLAKFLCTRQFILVTLQGETQQFTCISDEGKILDQVSHNRNQIDTQVPVIK